MNRFFTLAAGLMMLTASAETLTVFSDVENTNILVPISIDMLEVANSRCQMLYPADKLTAMKDMDIKSITFYTDGMSTLEGGELTILMGETTMSEFVDENFKIRVVDKDNNVEELTINDILPYGFTFDE